jgi:DNA-binding XRE family transcriptional regulator
VRKPTNRLSHLRWVNFLSQREIAEQLGISPQYYCKLEKNPAKIDLGMAVKLKLILKVRCIDELLNDAS